MPIYEYRCNGCQHKSSIFLRSVPTPLSPLCPACGSSDLIRLISSFAYHKSEQARLEEAGEPEQYPSMDYLKDPHNIGRWTEKKLKEAGMDMYSDEYKNTFSEVRDKIDRARDGDLSFLDEKGPG